MGETGFVRVVALALNCRLKHELGSMHINFLDWWNVFLPFLFQSVYEFMPMMKRHVGDAMMDHWPGYTRRSTLLPSPSTDCSLFAKHGGGCGNHHGIERSLS